MAKKPNPLIAEAKKLPKASKKCGVPSWHANLKKHRPEEWQKLWDFMGEWTTDFAPDGIRTGLPDAATLQEFFKTNPSAKGFADFLPESPVAFRKFCREFGAIKCRS